MTLERTASPGIAESARALDLESKITLLTGATAWTLAPLDQIGLRAIVVSDGPVGVRGTGEIEGATSRLFPAPSAVAATWDTGIASHLGRVFAREARAHRVDVVLAPQVNIQRTPVAGRHFECFSEDPWLTSAISSPIIAEMQKAGVAATVKHYVANDSETARTQYTANVSEQAMREVYLAPFEHAVRTAGVWNVMVAYSGAAFGGETAPMTEHAALVTELLKTEWGFDGVVISDWLATTSTIPSALGGLDLVMPGPDGPWGDRLAAAVRAGDVSESEIDEKVSRILRLAQRVGALGEAPADPGTSDDDDEFLRRLAGRSTVVLRREDRLPLDTENIRSVALIGPNAVDAHVLGGGSSSVTPTEVITPVRGLTAALPEAEVTVYRGGDTRRHLPLLDQSLCRDPRDGGQGIRVTTFDVAGTRLSSEVLPRWEGWLRGLAPEVDIVELDTIVELRQPGEHTIQVGTIGRYLIEIDGVAVAHGDRQIGAEVVLDSTINTPEGLGGPVRVENAHSARLTARLGVVRAAGYGDFVRGELRHRPPGVDTESEIADAVAAAASADLAIVIVGTNDEVESEGWDRRTLALPGRQDELVRRVLEVAPHAVIAVNAGAPVLLPWLEEARTVLWTWFPGQACGDALADVLFGTTEPAGRLPWTLPATEDDVPVPDAIPDSDLVVDYAEGVHVGYRAWERDGRTPAREFGFGLGWTTWRYESIVGVSPTSDGMLLEVDVTNVGDRSGTETIQVYVEALGTENTYDRPTRWLGGFVTIDLPPGETARSSVLLPRRIFEVWDSDDHRWVLPTGGYRLLVGRSVRDIRLEVLTDYDSES